MVLARMVARVPSIVTLPLFGPLVSLLARSSFEMVHGFLRVLGLATLPYSLRHGWVRDVFASAPHLREVRVAVEMALECGENMRRCRGVQESGVSWKGDSADSIDPVTETDEANEALVTRKIQRLFPSHAIIGEEAAAAHGLPALTDAPTWIVDPIDGTTNFVHGNPLCVVSIGLCVGKVPTVGVVYDPAMDELYVATRGRGAYCNGRMIRVDAAGDTLEKALVLNEPGYERSAAGIAKISATSRALLERGVQAVRVTGSAVLSIIWVACGRANAYYAGLHEKDCPKPWDWCAGYVIATEAGATFARVDGRSYAGGPPRTSEAAFDIYSQSCIVASTPQLCADLHALIKDAVANAR